MSSVHFVADEATDDFPGLQLFPPEILACIVVFLPGEQLGRLKLTGSQTLWKRLRPPHIVKSINLGTDYVRFTSWPAFLNEFPTIEELSIYSRSRSWWSEFGLTLKMVPPTLRALKLSGNVKTVASFFTQNNVPFKFEEHTPYLESLDLTDITPANFYVMTQFPAALTQLRIPDWDGVSCLPDTLTHLYVRSSSEKGWRLILPELVSLEIDKLPDLRYLPRSLKSITGGTLSESDSSKPPETIGYLPRTVTKLNLTNFILPASSWPFLPPTLETLCLIVRKPESSNKKIQAHDPDTDLTVEVPHYPFELLPRSLAHLEICCKGNANKNFFLTVPSENVLPTPSDFNVLETNISSARYIESIFPPHLRTLIAPALVLSPNAATHLPSSLTRLRIKFLYEHICKHFPSGLKDLKASRVLMSPKLVGLLPISITKLDLKFNTSVGVDINYYTGRPHNYSSRSEGEIHRAYRNYLDWKSAPLPPRLTSLTLKHFNQFGNSVVQDQSLANLQELKIPHSIYFSDIAIPLLSRSLTTLDMSSSSIVSGKCFPFLPRSLTELSLVKSSKIYDHHIPHLPRGLKRLSLNTATALTNSCGRDLPRHLEYLNLKYNTKITEDILSDLPYPLQAFHPFIASNWSINV